MTWRAGTGVVTGGTESAMRSSKALERLLDGQFGSVMEREGSSNRNIRCLANDTNEVEDIGGLDALCDFAIHLQSSERGMSIDE